MNPMQWLQLPEPEQNIQMIKPSINFTFYNSVSKKPGATCLAEVAGSQGLIETLLDLMVDELHKGIVLQQKGCEIWMSEV